MAETDPWAGLVDPRAALAKRRAAVSTLASSSQGSIKTGESKKQAVTDTCDRFSHSSHSSRGTHPLSPTSHSAAKDREITCSSSISETYAEAAASLGLLDPDFDGSGDRAPAKVAKRLECGSSLSDCSINGLATPARAFTVANTVPSPTAHLSGPLAWRDGLARLDRWTPPCEGFRSGEWEAVHRAVAHFMTHYATEAVARGWTALDLFGVHGRAGASRVDSCGALMLPLLKNATALTADTITFGPLVYRRRPMPEAVLVWDLIGETA